MGELAERFPLFPLGLVLLPTEILPLHIFEERYKLMIGRCIEEETEFGIVWLAEGGLRDVGCSASVAQVLERTDDGRMNILARGGRPFQLVRRVEGMPHPAADVGFLEGQEGPYDEGLAQSARASD